MSLQLLLEVLIRRLLSAYLLVAERNLSFELFWKLILGVKMIELKESMVYSILRLARWFIFGALLELFSLYMRLLSVFEAKYVLERSLVLVFSVKLKK